MHPSAYTTLLKDPAFNNTFVYNKLDVHKILGLDVHLDISKDVSSITVIANK